MFSCTHGAPKLNDTKVEKMKYTILKLINLPFVFLLIYIFSIFFLGKKKFFKRIIFFNTLLILIFSLPITSYFLEKPLYPIKNTYEDNINIDYSIILVPAAGISYNLKKKIHEPSEYSIERIHHALNFSSIVNIPIIVSGGVTKKNVISEAEIIEKYVEKNFKKKLILEKKSINSYETSINIRHYINKSKTSNNIILITDLYHFHRMSGALEKKNIFTYFPKELFEKKKISYKDFIPAYESFDRINDINYAYLGIIYYLITNKMDFKDLFN